MAARVLLGLAGAGVIVMSISSLTVLFIRQERGRCGLGPRRRAEVISIKGTAVRPLIRAATGPAAPDAGESARGSSPAKRGGPPVADEAYRAVFLRVQPTGKDGAEPDQRVRRKEAEYAQIVAEELGFRRSTSRSSPPKPTASASGTEASWWRASARTRACRVEQFYHHVAPDLAGRSDDEYPWHDG
jgi:hypothetical protein